MIYYDSHSTRTMLQIKGSLLPQALRVSGILAILAFVVKTLELEGLITFPEGLMKDAGLYSGFQFTLAFLLVFRTAQSYNRFWDSAVQINSMSCQWYQAASSLCKFVEMSEASAEEVLVFKHRVVRLFSMLGATGMSALAVMEDEKFGIVNIEAFDHSCLDFLVGREDDAHRPWVVYQWIQALIVQNLHNGLLNIPAPVLTRVFQQLEKGMVDYSQVLLIMTIPFPFPYTQICWMLVRVNMIVSPFVMCLWTDFPWVAALFTLVTTGCIHTLSLIATEIENPLGDDVNDLPCHQYHADFNDHLVLLLQDGTLKPPVLLARAEMNPATLNDPAYWHKTLDEYYAEKTQEVANAEAPYEVKAGAADMALQIKGQQFIDPSRKFGSRLSSNIPAAKPQFTGASPMFDSVASRLRDMCDHTSNDSTRASSGETDVLKDLASDIAGKLMPGQQEMNNLLMRQVAATEQLVSRMVAADDKAALRESISARDRGLLSLPPSAKQDGFISLPMAPNAVGGQCRAGNIGPKSTGFEVSACGF